MLLLPLPCPSIVIHIYNYKPGMEKQEDRGLKDILSQIVGSNPAWNA